MRESFLWKNVYNVLKWLIGANSNMLKIAENLKIFLKKLKTEEILKTWKNSENEEKI